MGYPVEYGGKGSPGPQRDLVRDARDGRPLAAGQVRRAVRPLRRRDPAPRHRAPPRALPARRRHDGPAGLLRDDRDRPRLQRAGAAHDRDLRRGRAGVRHPHARRRRAQGLHRQRRPRRADGGRVRAADRGRRGARRARAARADPRRATASRADGVRLEDCGAKLGLNGVDNGRIWFDHVRVPRENLLDRYAQVRRGRHLLQPDREPDQALLHDDRHADPGADQRLRRVDQRDQGGADDRVRRALERRQFGPPGRATRRRC